MKLYSLENFRKGRYKHMTHNNDQELFELIYDSSPLLQYLDINDLTITFYYDGFVAIDNDIIIIEDVFDVLDIIASHPINPSKPVAFMADDFHIPAGAILCEYGFLENLEEKRNYMRSINILDFHKNPIGSYYDWNE